MTVYIKKGFIKLFMMTLACYPVVMGILSPYMLWYVHLSWDQYIAWIWSSLPMGMVVNGVLAIYIPFMIPKIDSVVDKKKQPKK